MSTPPAFGLHPLHLLVAAVGAGAVWMALRAARRGAWREPAAFTLLALVLRLVVSRRGLLIGPDAGFGRLVLAWGVDLEHPVYGGGFAALTGPAHAVLGTSPDVLFGLNLLLSAAAVPLAWGGARALAPERPLVARVVGVASATLPVALRLSGTEVMHVSLATVELVAVGALLAGLRAERGPRVALLVVSSLAAGLAVHIRPEAAPFPLALAALCLLEPRRAALPAGAVAVGAVAVALPRLLSMPVDAQAVQIGALVNPGFWLDVLWPRFGDLDRHTIHVATHASLTPLLLPLLALVGLVLGPRRPALALLAWWLVTTGPVLPKTFPNSDALRLQLAGQAPLVLLAGLGAAAVAERMPRLPAWGVPALLGLATLRFVPMVQTQWATARELELLRAAAAAARPGEVVRFADHTTHGEALGQVGAALGGATWRGLERGDPSGQLAWVGVTCRATDRRGSHALRPRTPDLCRVLLERCPLEPVHTAAVSTDTDIDISLPDGVAELGLFRVGACAGWPAPPRERR